QCLFDRNNTDLLAVCANQAHFTSGDVFVDRRLRGGPLVLSHFTLNSSYSKSWRPRRETACCNCAANCSTGREPRSTPSRVRTATDRVSTSRSPITRR